MVKAVVSGSGNNQHGQQEGEKMAESVLDLSNPTESSICIDTTGSIYDESVQGASRGKHSYSITTFKNYLDVSGAGEVVALVEGANVEAVDDGFAKSTTGTSWNSWFQSEGIVINPLTEDALITWPVEVDNDGDGVDGTQGTIREMGGLDDNPALNNSYSSGEYMLYQYNNSRLYMYEKGSNRGYVSQLLLPGDRIGLKVISGVVSYVHYRNSVETIVGVSGAKAEVPMYFKGSLYRGSTSSGHSFIGGVTCVKETVSRALTVHVYGSAADQLNNNSITELEKVGLIPSEGATYSLINAEKVNSPRWPEGREYSINHVYYIGESQSTDSIS